MIVVSFSHFFFFKLKVLCSKLYDSMILLRISKMVILDNFVVGLKDKRKIVRIADLVFRNL